MNKCYHYDVIIVGGGPAGLIAAIASARNGAKTLLVERDGCLGGMLTMAGTGPQMTYHAGKTQVVCGIPQELVARLVAAGFSPGHMEDFVGYASSVTPFDPEGFKFIAEQMVLEAGAEILYHTVYTGCRKESGQIKSVQLYSKGGFFEAYAKVFVDASADADLAFDSGVPTLFGRSSDHLAQPMTMNIRVRNVDREKMLEYIDAHRDDMLGTIPFDRLHKLERSGMQGAYSVIRLAKERGEFSVDRDMVLCFETNNIGEYILNMSRIVKCSAVDPFDLTKAEIEGRRQAHEILAFMRNYIPGFENCILVSTGPKIGVRESRKVIGVYQLTAEDLLDNVMFPDAIAMGGYPIDIHSPDGESMCHRYLKPASWYSIPYRSVITNEIKNLLVAGRCISATHEACAAIRVTPIVMAVAQGVGTAAALAATANCTVQNVDVPLLRERLKRDKAFLDEYRT